MSQRCEYLAAALTCGSIPLESGWLARILPPKALALLRCGPIKGVPPIVLGGGGRGGLQGVSRSRGG